MVVTSSAASCQAAALPRISTKCMAEAIAPSAYPEITRARFRSPSEICSNTAGSNVSVEKLQATRTPSTAAGRPGQVSTISEPRFHSSDKAAASPGRYRPREPDQPRPL